MCNKQSFLVKDKNLPIANAANRFNKQYFLIRDRSVFKANNANALIKEWLRNKLSYVNY